MTDEQRPPHLEACDDRHICAEHVWEMEFQPLATPIGEVLAQPLDGCTCGAKTRRHVEEAQ